MKSCKALVITAMAASIALAVSPEVLAQASNAAKYVVIDNVNSVSGQAEVGGKAAIPVDGNAVLDAEGNIHVSCTKGTHGAATTCSNIGTGSTTSFTGVPVVTLNAPTGNVTTVGSSLSWSTTNASSCYGLSAIPVSPSSGPAVTGWTKEWPASATSANGFSLNTLLASQPTGQTTSYEFTLRCYSSVGAEVGSTKVVPYTDVKRTVVFDKPASTVGTCETYLASLSTAERELFDAYKADNRGFTKVERTFAAQTSNQILGTTTGLIRPLDKSGLPGVLGDNQYLALTFSMPPYDASSGNTGRFSFSFNEALGQIATHATIVAISPCPGDFRPRTTSGEAYQSPLCRRPYNSAGGVIKGSSRTEDASTFCVTPPGQTMYINVALRNLYLAPGETIPADNCANGTHCGIGIVLGN